MYVCALRFCLLIFAFNSILTVDNWWEKSFRLEIIFSQNSFLFKRSLIVCMCVNMYPRGQKRVCDLLELQFWAFAGSRAGYQPRHEIGPFADLVHIFNPAQPSVQIPRLLPFFFFSPSISLCGFGAYPGACSVDQAGENRDSWGHGLLQPMLTSSFKKPELIKVLQLLSGVTTGVHHMPTCLCKEIHWCLVGTSQSYIRAFSLIFYFMFLSFIFSFYCEDDIVEFSTFPFVSFYYLFAGGVF